MSSPLVTVGMALYRGETYLSDAISSVLKGTYPNWELLAVDDHSPDGSADIVRKFEDSRIRLISNEVNLGLVGVRNQILAAASGSYIAWLDQDDLAYPERLSTQITYLESHPEVDICGSWTDLLTEQPNGSFTTRVERFPSQHAAIRADMLFLNPMACNTVTMRLTAFVDRGLFFNEAFGNSLDYDMWSNASDELLLHNLPVVLGAYRVHGSQTSQGAALEKMNSHAIEIQVDLARRALGIQMSDDDRTWHRLATIAPVLLTDSIQLAAIAGWFARLRAANQESQAFAGRDFDAALARQWTTVVLASARSQIPRKDLLRQAINGARQIGLPFGSLARSSGAGLRRRAARR